MPSEPQAQMPAERRAAMTWMQLLKRVANVSRPAHALTYTRVRNIDIETCGKGGGPVKLAAHMHPRTYGISASLVITRTRPHECGRYESMEGRGRTKQGLESRATQEAEAN